ncbi:MAG TPA: carbohydrate kinase family protein [Fervidobacterium sp.]|nr:carbohydrate kinase family protein [Fervidobacterium sp.]HPT54543.1 carbohydrate kinase family protein [Fervidobacterium sp.]HPZ17948.1 carbohydrate kinase family protein [Fervidobacterium sp.]HQE48412.1 carbohydrate kinase family protein [Fervidobacterium sp.]HUM42416.1 carbohydrate kinase family protein [Fervidobacterium sp.]
MTVTCIGKLNIDMFFPVSEVHINQNHISKQIDISIGGKGANVAVALSKLGIESHLIASVGKDEFGIFAYDKLLEFNVVPHLIKQPKNGVRTGITFIVVDCNGNNTMFNYLGTNILLSKQNLSTYKDLLTNSDIVFLQAGLCEDILEYLIDNKATIFLEYTERIDEKLVAGVKYASLNEHELLYVSGKDDIDSAAEHLINIGIEHIFVKLGGKGSMYISKDERICEQPLKIEPIDTTGAGDSFTAGCIYGILNNFTHKETLIFANTCGAITCTRKGTTEAFPTIEEVNNFKIA